MLETIIVVLLFVFYITFGIGMANSFRHWYWVWHNTDTTKGKATQFVLTLLIFLTWPLLLVYVAGKNVGNV